MRAIDVSNFTSPFDEGMVRQWLTQGIGLAIVEAVDPPPSYPPTRTREQLQVFKNAGMPTDAYLYLYFDPGIQGGYETDMRNKLVLLEGFDIRRLWLDVEDVETGLAWTAQARVNAIRKCLVILDAYPSKIRPTGIYTGAWWWIPRTNNSKAFADRALWASQFDDLEDPSTTKLFGGWSSCAIKQYAGDVVLSGTVTVDLSSLSLSEAALVPSLLTIQPQVFPVKDYTGPISTHWDGCPGSVDMFAATGTPILNMQSGRVTLAGADPVGGNIVLIHGDDGMDYYYAHMDNAIPMVAPNQYVDSGWQIGSVGHTGNADKGNGDADSHLHLGVGPTILTGNVRCSGGSEDVDLVRVLKVLRGDPVDHPEFDDQSSVPPVPDDYQSKFVLRGKYDWPGVASNLEGIIHTLSSK